MLHKKTRKNEIYFTLKPRFFSFNENAARKKEKRNKIYSSFTLFFFSSSYFTFHLTNMRPSFFTLLALSGFAAITNAIKFDLPAVTKDRVFEGTKCLAQYVPKDTLVLATVNVGEGFNQRVELEVILGLNATDCTLLTVPPLFFQILDDAENRNVYTKKSNVNGELRNAFNTNNDGDVMVCFTNILDDGKQKREREREREREKGKERQKTQISFWSNSTD